MTQKGHDAEKFVSWLEDQEEGLSEGNKYKSRVAMFHEQLKKPDVEKQKQKATLYREESIIF